MLFVRGNFFIPDARKKWIKPSVNYLSTYNLDKERLGGDDSDHVITVKEVSDSKLRVLIYSPSNMAIPAGEGNLLKLDFHNSLNYGDYSFDLSSVVASKEDNSSLDVKLENGIITTLAPRFFKSDGPGATIIAVSAFRNSIWEICGEPISTSAFVITFVIHVREFVFIVLKVMRCVVSLSLMLAVIWLISSTSIWPSLQ